MNDYVKHVQDALLSEADYTNKLAMPQPLIQNTTE